MLVVSALARGKEKGETYFVEPSLYTAVEENIPTICFSSIH